MAPLKIQLAIGHDPLSRKTRPGHITASGIIVRAEKILMIFHPYLQKWLQPGGHVETGESLIEAAQRELREETGISAALHPWHRQHAFPVDITTHQIPENSVKKEPAHQHYDVRYLFVMTDTAELPAGGEHQTAWKQIQDIDEPCLENLMRKLEAAHIVTH